MRSYWKSPFLGNAVGPIVVDPRRQRPWLLQKDQPVLLYTGKSWLVRQVRSYFLNRPYSYFIPTRPTDRLIRAKFLKVTRKRK